MILWILAAALTAAVVGALLRALLRGGEPARAGTDREVYRDQLAEIERDRARGTLPPAEADAARAEIGRRLLAAEREAEAAGGGPARLSRTARILAPSIAVALPVLALLIYLPTGRPDLPGQPLADRDLSERSAQFDRLAAARALEARLAEAPTDREGWIGLGEAWFEIGDAAAAADAWGRAIGLGQGEDPILLSRWSEAMVFANDGVVTAAAIDGFERVLDQAPQDPRARYYLALGRSQAGDDRGALAAWQALLADTPQGASWRDPVRERIAETARRLGLDPAEALPEAAAPAIGGDDGAAAAIAALPPEARAAAIRDMVDGLAARLATAPDDPEGWLRLGQARMVLGEPDEAARAFAEAASRLPDDPATLSAWADARLAAGDGDSVPPEFEAAMRRLLATHPDSPQALWFLGTAAARDGDAAEAARLWGALADQFDPDSPERATILGRIAALGQG